MSTPADPVEAVITGHLKFSSAASILGVDAASVSRLYMRGVLRGVCIDGVRFVSTESLEQFIARRATVTQQLAKGESPAK